MILKCALTGMQITIFDFLQSDEVKHCTDKTFHCRRANQQHSPDAVSLKCMKIHCFENAINVSAEESRMRDLPAHGPANVRLHKFMRIKVCAV